MEESRFFIFESSEVAFDIMFEAMVMEKISWVSFESIARRAKSVHRDIVINTMSAPSRVIPILILLSKIGLYILGREAF
jgi:hypothetical protein